MMRVYNFESTAYRLFLWLGTIFAFFNLFEKHSFSKLCLKSKNKSLDIEEARNFKHANGNSNMPMSLLRIQRPNNLGNLALRNMKGQDSFCCLKN